mgnify:CR=1 FL=1
MVSNAFAISVIIRLFVSTASPTKENTAVYASWLILRGDRGAFGRVVAVF